MKTGERMVSGRTRQGRKWSDGENMEKGIKLFSDLASTTNKTAKADL